MEIKINCLRNGIEGGGASTESSNLLDGYGTYLYDLYKPSDDMLSTYPDSADVPLGIAYPAGNVLFKSIKTTTATTTYAPPYEEYRFEYSDNNKETIKKEPIARYVCTYFYPSMYRELTKNGTIDNINSHIKYIMNSHPLYNDYAYRNHLYYPVLNGEPIDIQSFANDKSSINKVSLAPAQRLSTGIKDYMNYVTNVAKWDNTTNNYDDATLKNTIYTAFFPIFEFMQPSIYEFMQPSNVYFVSHIYNSFFSTEELSKINNADLEYYKKSAVLIYKKDLMDFKNFFKKIMDYNMEINTYIQSLGGPES